MSSQFKWYIIVLSTQQYTNDRQLLISSQHSYNWSIIVFHLNEINFKHEVKAPGFFVDHADATFTKLSLWLMSAQNQNESL